MWAAHGDEVPERNETIMRELYDYHALMGVVPALFDELTNGRISKPNTDIRWVVEEVNERVADSYDEGWQDGFKAGQDDCATD